jgi:hypothetical protein
LRRLTLLPETTSATEYVFPNYWGGATKSTTPPIIHSKLNELRRAIGAVKAVKAAGGPQFPVRGAKDLAQKLAQALQDLDLLAPVIKQEVNLIDTDRIPKNENRSGNPVFRTLAHVTSTVRICASDGSYVDMVGSGHGGDVDDKAGGKADTYAWKSAILKGLTIPHEDMVDTDDDSSEVTERTKAPVKAARTKDSGGGVPPGDQPGNVGNVVRVNFASGEVVPKETTNYDAASAFIKAAKSLDQLGGIKKALMEGAYQLDEGEKLKLTREWAEKRKELMKEGN